jgi:hypothetical protein
MSIDELLAALAVAREELGGDAKVVRRDDGSDPDGVVRIECITPAIAVIYDLGNGGCTWTLDEEKPGTTVRCLMLD